MAPVRIPLVILAPPVVYTTTSLYYYTTKYIGNLYYLWDEKEKVMWELIPWIVGLLTIIGCQEIITYNGEQISLLNSQSALKSMITEEVEDEITESSSTTKIYDEENVVNTTYGPVRGYEMKEAEILQYLDIPYAAYNTTNPFQEPTNPEPWIAVREITEHSSRCPQLDSDDSYTETQDCLTLSIFVPKEVNNADVLFHVHDGDFVRGSGDPRIYGPGFLVSRNIILILPNYRLGPLGFLCLNSGIAPGNAALKDLTMALAWTRKNIEAFGGNPLNIVISGTGTGAALAQYLAVVPASSYYVSKVITESGCILSHWAIDRNPLETASKLISRLNTSERAAGYGNILNTSLEHIIRAAKGLVFRPCIEKQGFLKDSPWHLLQDQKFNKSFMFGATDRPGIHKAMQYTEESVSALNRNIELLLPNDLAFQKREQGRKTAKIIKRQYFGNKTISLERRNELSLCHTDCSYLSPAIRTARLLVAAKSIVYLYEFSFINKDEKKEATDIQGVAQGASLRYVFQKEEHVPIEAEEDSDMTTLMTNLWVSFIQTGKPTSEGIEWEELKASDVSNEAYLSIDSKTDLKKGFHPNRLSLWTELYNEHFIERNRCTKTIPSILWSCVALIIFM